MLTHAVTLDGPAAVRFPKGIARVLPADQVGSGLDARKIRAGRAKGGRQAAGGRGPVGDVCILAVGKMVEAAEEAAEQLAGVGVEATVWDVRVVKPLDQKMLADAA